jgi:drug/metabolite transporter (DMT)-like permease
MLNYLLAVLAAGANAASSVLQRKANRQAPAAHNLSWKLIADLLRTPVWFAGIVALIAGFLLQASALGTGDLATVEPVLVLELPMTLMLGSRVFGNRLSRREWLPAAAMTAGLAGLLYGLAPTAGRPLGPGWTTWVAGIGSTLLALTVLVCWAVHERGRARRNKRGGRVPQAAILGVAAGATFGLTAAFMKGMTQEFAHGFGALFTTWELYGMVASGLVGMFLMQSALNAGRLIAAQPGLTLTDPVVAVAWGVFAFGEHVRGGLYTVLEVASFAAVVAGAIALSRSPLLTDSGAQERQNNKSGPSSSPTSAGACDVGAAGQHHHGARG